MLTLLPLCVSRLTANEPAKIDSPMQNPLLAPSPLPYGAPQFDKIRPEHYLPAFTQAISEAKADIDAIADNPEAPCFKNTIVALEEAGEALTRVSSIAYNLLEAESTPELQDLAVQISPMMNDYEMYVSLNPKLFSRIKALWDSRSELSLSREEERLLDKYYKDFTRSGALLGPDDQKLYKDYNEKLSLLTLKYGQNLLASTNEFSLELSDEADLEGLPQYVRDAASALAKEKGKKGWVFDLSYPSYSPFMQYSTRSDLRHKLYMAYNSRAFGGAYDNTAVCAQIAELRLKIAQLLGYSTYADYVLEERMAKNITAVRSLMDELLEPSLTKAREEVSQILSYAKANGYKESELKAWDFSFWSEKYRESLFDISEEALKPYFQLESSIDAVFGLATRLYGLRFTPRPDIPGYHPDVKVYEVSSKEGRHLALFYADFFPRPTKRSGAWMTEFRTQCRRDGVDRRPFVSIVTNFSRPTEGAPALLTHYELTTFLHEFGHSLHGMLSDGTYPSLSGTNVATDFVELPSQIMENWGFEKEYLKSFAKHYKTGESIPDGLIDKVVKAQNYNSGYLQVRQLHFGLIDLAWYAVDKAPSESADKLEHSALEAYRTLPEVPGTCISTSFSHIFSSGYAAGYYSYKWAEVLEADAFSRFKEEGIFNPKTAYDFRHEILERGSSDDEATLYRNFRGHDPKPSALLDKLGIPRKAQ